MQTSGPLFLLFPADSRPLYSDLLLWFHLLARCLCLMKVSKYRVQSWCYVRQHDVQILVANWWKKGFAPVSFALISLLSEGKSKNNSADFDFKTTAGKSLYHHKLELRFIIGDTDIFMAQQRTFTPIPLLAALPAFCRII